MIILPKDSNGCPYLLLAPMEGVGDIPFRKAIASIGGFDEAIKNFLRVPRNGHIKSLAKMYDSNEISPLPITPQLMGSDLNLMGAMAKELEKKGALRIDLNCGCPSNLVTRHGAGSSLLKNPQILYQVARSMVSSVSIPVTIKMRSGYADTSLFKENLLAAQESGIQYITLHPRTKVDGYKSDAKWELIAKAKSLLKIPIIGNGDILNPDDAIRMLKMTNCDALMIGRGSIINPFLFHQIRAYFSKSTYVAKWRDFSNYLKIYQSMMPSMMSEKVKINKMKQLFDYLFKSHEKLLAHRKKILRATPSNIENYLKIAMPYLQENFECIFKNQNI